MAFSEAELDVYYLDIRRSSHGGSGQHLDTPASTNDVRGSTQHLHRSGLYLSNKDHHYHSSDVLRTQEREILTADNDKSLSEEGLKLESNKDIDGGTAWLCVLGAFIMTALMGGIEKSFGVLLITIQAEFNCTTLQASWIGSLMPTLRHIMGVFSSLLAQRFGGRKVALVGALLMFASVCSSSFVKSLPVMYFTYGVIPGIGASLMYISMALIINERFIRLRGKANGISLAGSGLGSFGGPVLIQYLLDTYGLSGEMLIIGGITANYLLCVALFIPAIQPRKTSERYSDEKLHEVVERTNDCEQLQNTVPKKKSRCSCSSFKCSCPPIGFILYAVSIALICAGAIANLFNLPSLALLNENITPSMAALLLSIVGICDMIGRITSGIIFDLEKVVRWRLHLYGATFLLMALMNLALPFCTQYYQMCLCAAVSGYCLGVVIGQRAVICLETVGEDLLKKFYGYLISAQGVGFLIGPAAAGALKDHFVTEGYATAFYFASAAQFLAALLFTMNIVAGSVKVCYQKQHSNIKLEQKS